MLSESEAKQRAYYDEIAATYDSHYGSDHNLAYRHRLFDRYLNEFTPSNTKVLDAMCGGGQNSSYFVSRRCLVTGIDISSNQCEHYRRRFPQNQIICGSVLETQLPGESRDLVFTDSLHHLHPHVDGAMAEFDRVLKPGGHLVLWEPSAKSIVDVLRKVWYSLDRKYFEENEASIDIERLARDHSENFEMVAVTYGGNVAYLSVVLSMAMRIPLRWVDRYARAAFWLEDKVSKVQGRRTSLWALAVFRKR